MTKREVNRRLLISVAAPAMIFSAVSPAWAQAPAETPAAQEPAMAQEPAAAATPAAGQAADPTEIIVTAQKRQERLNDVPLAISAASGIRLQQQGIESVGDLTKLVPGFQYANTGIVPVYTLRGVGFYDNTITARGTVALYVDEVALPFSVIGPAASFDVERVEVLKGPQGTLFGQNSTGGAINYIAAKPTPDFHAGVKAEFGSYDRGFVEGYVSGPLSPTLTARIAVREEFGNGWQKTFTGPSARQGERNNQYGRLTLDWKPTDRLRFALNATAYHTSQDPQVPQLFAKRVVTASYGITPAFAAVPLPPHNDRAVDFDRDKDFFERDKFALISLRGEYDVTDDIKLVSISAYEDFKRHSLREGDGSSVAAAFSEAHAKFHTFQQELRLGGTFGGKGNWLLGGNYERDKADDSAFISYPLSSSAGAYVAFTGKLNLGTTNYVLPTYTSKSLFGNADFPLTDTLTVRGGVRYTKFTGNATSCLVADDPLMQLAPATSAIINISRARAGLAPIQLAQGSCVQIAPDGLSAGPAISSLNEHNVSWRGGIDWKPTKTALFYGSVSRGYKSGSFPLLTGPLQASYFPTKQESLTAYEIGFKVGILDRVLQLNGAAFYYDYKDKQFLGRVVSFLGPVARLVNVPKSNVKGAELQLDITPSRQFRTSLAATYLDTKVGDYANYDPFGRLINFKGQRFPFAPKFQTTADAEYTQPLNGDLGLFVGGSFQHQGKTNAAFGNTPEFAIKAYSTADLRIGLTDSVQGWRVSGFVRNVGNTYYWTTVARFTDAVVRYTGMPRTYGVNLSYRW